MLWVVVLLGYSLGQYRLEFIERLETWSYDLRLLASIGDPPPSPVVVIDIDEFSLSQFGRWPWPRNLMAAMMDELFERQQVALVAFDVVFAEPDESSGLPVLEALAEGRLSDNPDYREALLELRESLDNDRIFAAAVHGRPVVMGYYFSAGDDSLRVGQLPAPVFRVEQFGEFTLPLIQADGYGANLALLQDAAATAGHFIPLFDSDGRSRRVPLLIEYDGGYYESLSLAAARTFLGWPPLEPLVGNEPSGGYLILEAIGVAGREIPVDVQAAAFIPYVGPERSFPYLSAAHLLNQALPPGLLQGRIALVGTSAPGLMDLRSTPVGNAYPGVEIHANLIHGILTNTIRQQPAYLIGFEILALLILGGALALALPRFGPLGSLLLTIAALGLIVGLAQYVWEALYLVLPVAAILLAITGIYALDTVYSLFIESRARARISGLFGQYVPPRVVGELAENPELASMAGDTRDMSVLFSDIRGFTRMSEGMSAQELSDFLNDYLSQMTLAIQRYDGTVDKYIGDAIMAFWGAPLPLADHALKSVQTALAMQALIVELRVRYPDRGWPAPRVGIGVNSGLMNVGNMGSAFRRAYTVLGDSVNLAARLEGLTKYYGAPVIVSHYTLEATEHAVFYRELDRIRVKGKTETVGVFEPLALRPGFDQSLPGSPASEQGLSAELEQRCSLHALMLAAYRRHEWDQAEELLAQLAACDEYPELVDLFGERIKMFRDHPPPDTWDGVFCFEAK